MTCRCPIFPVLDGTQPVGASVRCSCCGTPLRLTCDGCNSEPAGIPAVVSEGPLAEWKRPDVLALAPNECERCHQLIPRGRGRPPKVCDGCLSGTERAQREAKRRQKERKKGAAA